MGHYSGTLWPTEHPPADSSILSLISLVGGIIIWQCLYKNTFKLAVWDRIDA